MKNKKWELRYHFSEILPRKHDNSKSFTCKIENNVWTFVQLLAPIFYLKMRGYL